MKIYNAKQDNRHIENEQLEDSEPRCVNYEFEDMETMHVWVTLEGWYFTVTFLCINCCRISTFIVVLEDVLLRYTIWYWFYCVPRETIRRQWPRCLTRANMCDLSSTRQGIVTCPLQRHLSLHTFCSVNVLLIVVELLLSCSVFKTARH